MQLAEFRSLSYEEQVDVLYREGIYIGKKKAGNEIILLYQLDYYYVKIFYSSYRENVRTICIFTSTRFLSGFLNHIDIEELKNLFVE